MDRIIVFIGPSLVGKTTVSRRLALLLNQKKISTDSLCLNHTYHQDDPEETIELFDDLKEYIIQHNVRIVDIGANTIETCGAKELDYLKKVLTVEGNEPIFYLLLPSKDNNTSFQYLSKVGKKLYGERPDLQISIKQSLLASSYRYLNPTVFYTLEGYKQPIFSQKNAYVRHLELSITDKILHDFILKKNIKR